VVLSVLSSATRTPDVPTTQGWVQKPFHETLLLTEISRALHPTSGPGRILLVEDDEDLATVVLSGFRTIGDAGAGKPGAISVDHVSSLAEAETYCQANAPDLLILDLTLRDGSGFALVDWLRRQPKLRTLPLVVYSGSELSEAEMAQLRLGPTQFLTKARVQPHHVEDLILAMVRHLGKPAMGSVSA
jgi:CheY-like chemotaxis protein